MSNLPKMRTQEDALKEQAEQIKNGGERGFMLALLSNMTGSATRGLPVTDDHDKLAQTAARDFQRNDFSEAVSTVESLALIVDYYKDLAENYLQALTDYAISVDEYGNVDNYPFVLRQGGEEKLGQIEVFDLEEIGKDDLWDAYVQPYLQFATDSEKQWIAEEFSDFIKEQA